MIEHIRLAISGYRGSVLRTILRLSLDGSWPWAVAASRKPQEKSNKRTKKHRIRMIAILDETDFRVLAIDLRASGFLPTVTEVTLREDFCSGCKCRKGTLSSQERAIKPLKK